MAFRKFRETISQTRQHMRTALDPERLRAEMDDAKRAALYMPNLDPATAVACPQVPRVQPVPAEQARAERAGELDRLAGPATHPIRIDRFTVSGGDLDEVARALDRLGLLDRADRVWGVFPAPVLLEQGRGPEEWIVVHAGVEGGGRLGKPAAGDLHSAAMDRLSKWIDRPKDEGIAFDEEVGALYAERSGIAPERSLGIHRVLEWTTNVDAADPWAASCRSECACSPRRGRRRQARSTGSPVVPCPSARRTGSGRASSSWARRCSPTSTAARGPSPSPRRPTCPCCPPTRSSCS